MKNILLIGSVALTLFACNSKNNVEIKGEIKNAGKQKVYLERLDVTQPVITDSTTTNRKGNFSFKTAVTDPTFYTIRVGGKEAVTILAEADKKIEISGELNDLSNNYWVDGSEGSLWIKLLDFQLNKTRHSLDSIEKLFHDLPEEEQYNIQRSHLSTEWDSVYMKQVRFSQDFILKHAISPASYYALYQKINANDFVLPVEINMQSLRAVASALKAMYPNSQYTQAILGHYNQTTQELRNQKMKQLITNSENDLPNISLPNINGDTISLKSFKGKYILIDFTVLSAPESQKTIQELKNIYNKYHSKGVEIYQVCLDPNKTNWENAVRRYNINWTCVRDDASEKSIIARLWNIQNLPANYIVNKKYEIVGKNLSGQRLEDRLNDIIK